MLQKYTSRLILGVKAILDKLLKNILNRESKIYVLDYNTFVVRLLRFIFIVYTIFLSHQLLFGSERLLARNILISNRNTYINWIPFNTISLYFEHFEYFKFWDWISNIFGNVIIFMPIGALLPSILSKHNKVMFTLGIGFFLSLSIEIAQYYFCLGVFDVDDLILNVLGVILGYVFYKIITNAIKTMLK